MWLEERSKKKISSARSTSCGMPTCCKGMMDASFVTAHQVFDCFIRREIDGVRGACTADSRKVVVVSTEKQKS